jgi:uncharacterized protein
MTNEQAYLGTGWSFPPTFDRKARAVDMVRAETDIQQSLHLLLSTTLGERVMQPTYGCNLDQLLFEPLSLSVITFIKDQVETAIIYHEPRIELENLDLSLDEQTQGLVRLSIDYLIVSTNTRSNYVFPFYLEEGIGTP